MWSNYPLKAVTESVALSFYSAHIKSGTLMMHIDQYNGKYSITQDGRVWSSVGSGKWLTPQFDGDGYLHVSLSDGFKLLIHKVHRLVAKAFIPNPNNYPIVNHLDKIRDNNHKSNLEWCTSSHNNQHSAPKLNWEKVRIIKRLKGDMTQKDIGKIFGICNTMVCLIHKGKAWVSK